MGVSSPLLKGLIGIEAGQSFKLGGSLDKTSDNEILKIAKKTVEDSSTEEIRHTCPVLRGRTSNLWRFTLKSDQGHNIQTQYMACTYDE